MAKGLATEGPAAEGLAGNTTATARAMGRRQFLRSSAAVCAAALGASAGAALCASMAGCSNSEGTDAGEASGAQSAGGVQSAGGSGLGAQTGASGTQAAEALPPAQPGSEEDFFVDANVNMETLDLYLGIPGVEYRDLRLLDDPADFAAIGGDSKLSFGIAGFKVVPYPWVGSLAPLPVSGAYAGDCLFEVTWGDGLQVVDARPRYTQSMQILQELFPQDRPIVLCCGGGGYAAMTRQVLIHLGWSSELLYCAGGQWDYLGDNLVQLISYKDPEKPEYYFWRADLVDLDFGLLYPA